MVVLLFLLSPVLVELVDFNSSIALLEQVKGLHVKGKHILSVNIHTPKEKTGKAQSFHKDNTL